MDAQSITRTARLTGIAYLGIIAAGVFAEFFVRSAIVVPGDAALTAGNIAASEGLFRAGIAADLLMIGFDVAVAVGLYVLLRSVHRPLAMVAAAFRLIQAAILGANLFNMADALQFATGAAAGSGPAATQMEGLALVSMETHALAYDLGLVFFGVACVVLGYLFRSSRFVPVPLAVALALAGVVYLVGSFVAVLAPDLSASLEAAYYLPFVAEIAVAGWLVVKSVSVDLAPQTHQVAVAT